MANTSLLSGMNAGQGEDEDCGNVEGDQKGVGYGPEMPDAE